MAWERLERGRGVGRGRDREGRNRGKFIACDGPCEQMAEQKSCSEVKDWIHSATSPIITLISSLVRSGRVRQVFCEMCDSERKSSVEIKTLGVDSGARSTRGIKKRNPLIISK